MRKHHRLASLILVATAFVSVAVACKGKPPVTPPPPVLRPEPLPKPAPVSVKSDCDPFDPSLQPDARTYAERAPRIQEAQRLSEEALAKLQAAEGASLDPLSREQLVTDAVTTFLDSLAADPYNVNSTYNLAAAYARIGRKMCAYNMLDRLIQMKNHHSRQAEVNQKLDRLLGRNRTQLDPDFRELRSERTFDCLINNIGTATPQNCLQPRS